VQDFERSQGIGGSGGGSGQGDEEEYDGYEELSIPIANPPPRIDEDVSPPSPSDPSHPEMYPGITPQLHQDAISSHREEEEPMTPPPNDFATLDFGEQLTSSTSHKRDKVSTTAFAVSTSSAASSSNTPNKIGNALLPTSCSINETSGIS